MKEWIVGISLGACTGATTGFILPFSTIRVAFGVLHDSCALPNKDPQNLLFISMYRESPPKPSGLITYIPQRKDIC